MGRRVREARPFYQLDVIVWRRVREADGRIKPGAQAPGSSAKKYGPSPRSGRQRCRPLRGLGRPFFMFYLGLAPQALLCRPLRGLGAQTYLAW